MRAMMRKLRNSPKPQASDYDDMEGLNLNVLYGDFLRNVERVGDAAAMDILKEEVMPLGSIELDHTMYAQITIDLD